MPFPAKSIQSSSIATISEKTVGPLQIPRKKKHEGPTKNHVERQEQRQEHFNNLLVAFVKRERPNPSSCRPGRAQDLRIRNAVDRTARFTKGRQKMQTFFFAQNASKCLILWVAFVLLLQRYGFFGAGNKKPCRIGRVSLNVVPRINSILNE